MDGSWGSVVGALAVLIIPIAAWFAPRATQEGRLMLRVERLGKIFVTMPESTERETFEEHYRSAVSSLNDWLDLDARALRRAARTVAVATYLLGLTILVLVVVLGESLDSTQRVLVGLGIGTFISIGSFGGRFLLEMRAAERRRSENEQARLAEVGTKLANFRDGRPFDSA